MLNFQFQFIISCAKEIGYNDIFHNFCGSYSYVLHIDFPQFGIIVKHFKKPLSSLEIIK